VTFLALLFIAAAPAVAAQNAATMTLEDGSEVSFAETGAWSVRRGRHTLASNAGAALWVGDQYQPQQQAHNVELLPASAGAVQFRGNLSVGGVSLQFTQTVRHINRGLMVSYGFESFQLPQARSVAVSIDLPLATYGGSPFVAGGEAAGKFPVEPAKEARLVAQPARRLVVASPQQMQLLVETREPEMMVLQDARPWGSPTYQLLLVPAATAPRREVTFFIAFAGVKRGPRLARLQQSRRTVGLYEPFELTLDFWGQYKNPYDPDDVEVTCRFDAPSGKSVTVAGFLYQGYRRAKQEVAKTRDGRPVTEIKEVLTPEGARVWKVRFAPAELGTYTYFVDVKTRQGRSPLERGFFAAAPSDDPGFMRVSKKDPRFFEFDNGKPYFGVGHNVCWARASERTYDYDLFFGRMHRAGENLSRIWFCSWDMNLEGKKLDEYQLDNAWRMDYVLGLASRYGIYVKLCLDNFYDYRDEEAIKLNPYFKANGGPIEEPGEFFTDPVAERHYKRRLRYVVSRWGHMPIILAWEQWNEANYMLYKKKEIAEWSGKTARHLRSIDPYGHLNTTTLGPDKVWEEVWQVPELDFAQHHPYIRGLEEKIEPEELDAVDLVAKASAEVSGFGKPFLLGEFGYVGHGKSNPLNEQDKLGVALHNALWSSAFSGAAATAANWWWDTYIHPNDLYYHYAALAKFVRDIDWTGGAWRLVKEDAASPVRIRGLANRTRAYLWIQQRGNSWYRRVAQGHPAQPLRNVTIRIANLRDGTYRVEWYNTYKGAAITHCDRATERGVLTLSVPNAGPDVACKVAPAE